MRQVGVKCFCTRSELNAAAVFLKGNVTGRPSHTAQNLRARPENNRTNLLGHGPEAPRLRGPCARARALGTNRVIGKCTFFYGNTQNDQGERCSVCWELQMCKISAQSVAVSKSYDHNKLTKIRTGLLQIVRCQKCMEVHVPIKKLSHTVETLISTYFEPRILMQNRKYTTRY